MVKKTKCLGRKQSVKNSACLNDEIAKLAYQLYMRRGFGDGSDLEDWLRAEKIVISRCK